MSDYIERYWRDATPEDAIAEPPMVARFKTDSIWAIDEIIGFRKSEIHKWLWYDSKGELWICCQVYDAPDPGEGYRLIDTENEKGEVGDEFLTQSGVWLLECRHNGFEHGVPYRRRIEPPKPKYVPFTWEDREQLRGRWVCREEDSGVTFETILEKLESDGCGLFLINGYTPKQMLDSWRFVDTGEPVGKMVTQ